jgi:GntR family transcriptional regulator
MTIVEPSLSFRLNPASGVPTFLQLVRQVEHALSLGHLTVGDQLPTVREVVASLAINPNTVSKAYRELEHLGVAGGRPGQGTFIIAAPSVISPAEQRALRRGLDRWLAHARSAGLDAEGMTALFSSALREVEADRSVQAS